MISLGEFEGYVLVVNQSNVDPDMVTYHLYKDGEEKSFAREDAFCSLVWGLEPDDHLYAEAARRFIKLGRPHAGEFDPLFTGRIT